MEIWNFLNCIGIVDGKYVMMDCFSNVGLVYYNYKGFYSVVFLVMCDVKYCFMFLYIGVFDSINDVSIFLGVLFREMFENNFCDLYILRFLLNGNKIFFYVVVVDDIFFFKLWFMKLYFGRNLSDS